MSITRDPERLSRVTGQLREAIRARVKLPVLGPGDAAGLVMTMHAELDAAIAERSASAAAAGQHIACSAGCSSCCVSPLLVTEGEAVTVAEWLADNADVRAWFTAHYPGWKRDLGTTIDKLHAANTDEERREAMVEYKRKNVMCAFNREGLCAIYPARPARCRKAHALDTNEHCGPTGDGKVKYYEHPRTEMTFSEQEPMRAALHHALRPSGRSELLCTAVQRLTQVVGRNDPCPCGSGQKYKRCCGR